MVALTGFSKDPKIVEGGQGSCQGPVQRHGAPEDITKVDRLIRDLLSGVWCKAHIDTHVHTTIHTYTQNTHPPPHGLVDRQVGNKSYFHRRWTLG